MTNNIGAELTALSAPGFGYGYPRYRAYGPYSLYRPYGGVFFGAETPAAPPTAPGGQRTGVLADVAPVMAPATGDVDVQKRLDDKQILHVEICVDGKCYRTSMDLAPTLALVVDKLNQWHQAAHAQPPLSTIVSTVGEAVDAAGSEIANIMVGHHVETMTGGWLSDIGGAIGGTLRKLQPVISTVATSVATTYGGPTAGAAAAKLSPMITSFQADLLDPKGSPQKKAVAQQALASLKTHAANNPAKAQALAAANQAVKNTAVAYHVKNTAQQAAAGDAKAQTDINALVTAAEQGDPAAKSTFDVLAQTFAQEIMKSEAGAKLWERVTGRGPGTLSPTTTSGWYDIIGAVAEAPLLPSYPIPLSGWYDIVGSTTLVGSFWGKVKNGLLTVTLIKPTNQFIKDNKLESYVKMAATAVATAYGGPAAGAAAGALSGPVMNLGVKDKQQSASAQRTVQNLKDKVQTNPQLASAVDVAQAAIEQTATAYQVSQLVKDAKAGDLGAQRALENLQNAASRGDQDAATALQAAATLDREQTAAGPIVGQWYDIADTVIRMEVA